MFIGLKLPSIWNAEEEKDMENNGVASFLLGLGVGIGIGILLAPKSGQETRELLKNKAEEGADFLKKRSEGLKQSATEWADKGKEAITRQKEHLSDAMEAGRQAYRETVQPPTAEPPVEGSAL
jgi:gas vesicle protein